MIIVSQDKSVIVNFNNIEAIEIGNVEENQCKGIIYARLVSDYFYKIGEYKTEERAKEVLQEIINKYSSYLQLNGGPAIMKGDIDIQPNIFNIPKVYYMPKE